MVKTRALQSRLEDSFQVLVTQPLYKMVSTHSGLGPSTSSSNQDDSPQVWPRAALIWAILQLKLSLLKGSLVVLVDHESTRMWAQQIMFSIFVWSLTLYPFQCFSNPLHISHVTKATKSQESIMVTPCQVFTAETQAEGSQSLRTKCSLRHFNKARGDIVNCCHQSSFHQ